MSAFALIPGAGGAAWYWSRVAPLLAAAGHTALPIDLPADDEHAGLPEYARISVDAINTAGARDDVVVVAQSMGGFTAPLVCEAVPVRALVFVNAMIPVPGETAGAWWDNTAASAAREALAAERGWGEFDVDTYFMHDVPSEIAAEGAEHDRDEADAAFASPCAFTAWPDVPIRVVAGADDRFFPVDFQRRVARERLGIEADVLPGGHLMALAHPRAVADYLLAVTELR
jgi:alpha-beta hydrolase superfamily lysophospholipase